MCSRLYLMNVGLFVKVMKVKERLDNEFVEIYVILRLDIIIKVMIFFYFGKILMSFSVGYLVLIKFFICSYKILRVNNYYMG